MSDSSGAIVALMVVCSFVVVAVLGGIAIFKPELLGLKKRDQPPPDDSDGGGGGGGDGGETAKPKKGEKGGKEPAAPAPAPAGKGVWKKATATHYTSYPACCHDRNADQSECKGYSGCTWAGQFAALDGKQSPEWVKKTNIVAFYESPESNNKKVWDSKYKNKKIRVRHPKSGKTIDAVIYDTCSDKDCGGCCSQNASKNGGFLVDLEINTAQRFYGTNNPPGMETVEWQLI